MGYRILNGFLNPRVPCQPLREDEKPEFVYIEVAKRNKKFAYDANSMALLQVDAFQDYVDLKNNPPSPYIMARYKPVFFPNGPVDKKITTLVLEATHDCDLRCKYCFVTLYPHKGEDGDTMTFPMAKRALDDLVDTTKKFSTGFFGGEPMLNWDLIVQVTHYAEELARKHSPVCQMCGGSGKGKGEPICPACKGLGKVRPGFHITTNGTLFTPERVRFLDEHGYSLIVSIDGRQHSHDAMRPYKDGRGSWERVIKGLEMLKGTHLVESNTLRSTFPANSNESIADRLEFLNQLCFTKDTKIPLLDGTDRSLEELMTYPEQIWVYSYDKFTNRIVPGKATKPFKTGEKVPVLKITLDNGQTIRCTPGERFLTRGGSYIEAKNLKPGNSLMPLYRAVCSEDDPIGSSKLTGYQMIKDPGGSWVFTHRRVCEFVDRSAKLEDGGKLALVEGKHGLLRHHLNFNKTDNRPDNLVWMDGDDHLRFHSFSASDRLKTLWTNFDFRTKCTELAKERIVSLWKNPEFREMMQKVASRLAIKNWKDPVFRDTMKEAVRKTIAEGRHVSQTYTKTQEHREKSSERMKEYNKKKWDFSDPLYEAERVQTLENLTKQATSEHNKDRLRLLGSLILKCPECGKVCKGLGGLGSHFAFVHGDGLVRNKAVEIAKKSNHSCFECPECGLVCEGMAKLGSHVRNEHRDPNSPFFTVEGLNSIRKNIERINHTPSVCPVCGKQYGNVGMMKKHVKIEHEGVKYDLTKQKEAFVSSLRTRVRCSECGEEFANSGVLGRHKKRKHPVACSETEVCYNHKVVSVEEDGFEDVYDITVEKYHNFALSAGVFVHNCDDKLGSWVSVEPVALSHDSPLKPKELEIHTQNTWDVFEEDYYTAADWWVGRAKAGKTPRWHNVGKTVERLFYSIHSASECGASRGYLSCDGRGRIYACHREGASFLGSLSNGIDEQLRTPWLDNRIYSREGCGVCPARWGCGGGCREDSLSDHGNIHKPSPCQCQLKQLWIMSAMHIMSEVPKETVAKYVRDPGNRGVSSDLCQYIPASEVQVDEAGVTKRGYRQNIPTAALVRPENK